MTRHFNSKSGTQKQLNLLFIIAAAFLGGFLWRCRGDHGWGSLKGMTLVAAGLFILIYMCFPSNKKLTYSVFPFAVLMTAITNSGWGTLNSQITGYLTDSLPFAGSQEAAIINVSPFSAIAVMLLVGFGWMPFFAAAVAYFFSDKQWKWRNAIIIIAIYFATEYITKASVSHFLTYAVCPDATSGFAQSLKLSSIEDSPFVFYLKHFDNMSFAKKTALGRNYFQTVETVSQALGTLAAGLYIRVGLRDKKACKMYFCLCAAAAAAITFADVFMFINGGGFRNSFVAPSFISGWSNWEYFTGFFIGLFSALIIVKTNSCYTATVPELFFKHKFLPSFFYNYVAVFVFPIISAAVIPLAIRLSDEKDVILRNISFADEEALCLPFALIAAAALIYPAYRFTKAQQSSSTDLVRKNAPIIMAFFFAVTATMYFFTGNAYLLNGSFSDTTVIMYISTAVIGVCLYLIKKMQAQKTAA